LKLLENLDSEAVIVVHGTADNIQNVLKAINLPHKVIQPDTLHKVKLNPEQILYINCHPAGYNPEAYEKIRLFVKDGGQIISTDYTLNTLLQHVFPNTLRWDNASTGDETINIECNPNEKEDEVLKGFKNEETWRLAGGSHPITILDPNNVSVLISSTGLAKFNASNAVLIRFTYGDGVVYHMISHFELQHKNTITKAQLDAQLVQQQQQGLAQKPAVEDYAKAKGASEATVQKLKDTAKNQEQRKGDYYMDYDDFQNATTQSEMVMRSVVSKQKKNAILKQK